LPVVKKAPKKKPIGKCTSYDQLNTHFWNEELREWCRNQGLKVSGSKKELIHRILEHTAGEKENSSSAPSRANEDVETSEEEDGTGTDVAEDDEEEDEELETEEPVPPKRLSSLRSHVFALSGTLSRSREEIIGIIRKHKGEYRSTVTRDVTHILCADPDADSAKLNKAREIGIAIVSESYLAPFMH
jgi:NAD-dependent DNA ligase